MDLFPWLCDFCEIFTRLIGLKTLCSSVVSMKTSAARRPEAFSTIRHAYSTLPLSFSHFSLRLDCSSFWWCIQAHFLPNSQEDGVVQLPSRPALRLRLFSSGLPAPSFLSNLSSNYCPFSVTLKPQTSWLFNSLNTLLLDERLNSSRWSLQESKIRTENWETVWDFSHFGSRLLVVSITTFCYGFHRTCLNRNISRNREIP